MVATIAKAASADYYLHSQATFRPPGEYYLSGEEPDGVWWNPKGLFKFTHGEEVDSADFYSLYAGFDPDTKEPLTQNSGSEKRCPGYDITFNADKTVSALWAIAPPDLRSAIEKAHNDAAQTALAETIEKHCSYTRIRDPQGYLQIIPADIAGAMFQHGSSRSGDPHLHTHCVIFNVARAHEDGCWRALHGNPLYRWQKAAGAVYRAELAWLLQERTGIRMEQYGKNAAYTRVLGMPETLVKDWSKRDAKIKDTAAEFGVSLVGNPALKSAVQKMTRVAKIHGDTPEARHEDWMEQARIHIAEIDQLVASLEGNDIEITQEELRELTETLGNLPAAMTEHEAVFHYPELVARTHNACARLLSREARDTALQRVLRTEQIVRLDRPTPSPDTTASLAHTWSYTSKHNIELENAIHASAAEILNSGGLGVPAQATQKMIDALLAEGYPLSTEQITAIKFATQPSRIAIIEGAAGSGKTTTLRPIADLYRDRGCNLIATALPWKIAVPLAADIAAPPYSVDSLLKRAANGDIEINYKTVIFVDEAGMLSSKHAHHLLELGRTRGAKIIFAGDTKQQQPIEAGPGLRLIRDVADSIRVDKIRRQKPDLEDVLVALGRDRETARLEAETASPAQHASAAEQLESLPEESRQTVIPWQVTASEAFRDGNAAAAIAAYDERGRFHLENNLHAALTRLVDDWARYREEHPDKSAVVIAQTNAEVSVLSYLMRQRTLSATDTDRAVIEVCRGRADKTIKSKLEIARGDRTKIGATHWKKQLYNGTVVTIDDFRVDKLADGSDARVLIRGQTEDGRKVSFHHDEIRDFHGHIRLDYGYALTIASAQGLTADRCFLLANQKTARQTIYPAATRHTERLDIYVDRQPLVIEIRDGRPEDTAEDPVTNDDIKDYLARRWSRSQPKTAAVDYMSEGMRAEFRGEDTETRRRATDPDNRDGPAWAAANDNGDGLMRSLASKIRAAALNHRHGHTLDKLAHGTQELFASYRAHGARIKEHGNAAVVLTPEFAADISRNAVLLGQAAPYRYRTTAARYAPLLKRRGLDEREFRLLDAFYLRATKLRRDAQLELVRNKSTAEQTPAEKAGLDRPVSTNDDTRKREPPAEVAEQIQTAAEDVVASQTPRIAQALGAAWREHRNKALKLNKHPFEAPGYDELRKHMIALLRHKDLAPQATASIKEHLEAYKSWIADRRFVQDYLDTIRKSDAGRTALRHEARATQHHVIHLAAYPEWRRESNRVLATGQRILENAEKYGPHLDAIPKARAEVDAGVANAARYHRNDTPAEFRQQGTTNTLLAPQGAYHPRAYLEQFLAADDESRSLRVAMYRGFEPTSERQVNRHPSYSYWRQQSERILRTAQHILDHYRRYEPYLSHSNRDRQFIEQTITRRRRFHEDDGPPIAQKKQDAPTKRQERGRSIDRSRGGFSL